MKISFKRFMWLQRRAILQFAVESRLELEAAAFGWIAARSAGFRAGFKVF